MGKLIGLSVVNLLILLLLAPIYEGFVRKYIRAQVAHSRIGPPVWQPFLDIFKLMLKEDLRPSRDLVFGVAPMVCLGATLVGGLLVPIGTNAPLDMAGDFIVFIYIMGLSVVALIMGAMASSSPFAYVGATREMMMFLIVEVVAVVALITGAVNSHSLRFSGIISWYTSHPFSLSMILAGLALFLALQAQFGKLPFDIPEAETEIMGGPLIEMSGPRLALFYWAMWIRRLIYACLFASVFLPWGRTGIFALDALITLAIAFLVYVVIGVVEVVNPRLRIDQALSYYLVVLVALGLASMVLAYLAV